MPRSTSGVHVDTLVVGNGPSALILSFILHGHIPFYDASHPHPDPILRSKLEANPCLLDLNVEELTAHFEASRISYSTQALPINVLLDTLLRPLADVEPGEHESSVVWKYKPDRAVSHLVIGASPQAGGQWSENPVEASWDIGALSYEDQLSLPGFSLCEYLGRDAKSASSSCHRPTRRTLAGYFAAYPAAVGIEDTVRLASIVSGVTRVADGFYVASHDVHCRNLVLATGTFSQLIPPPKDLEPLTSLDGGDEDAPLLVLGSGFSAADIVISNVQKRKVLHVFQWDPETRPSPLQACHPQAYPEYAGVYRHMKATSKQQIRKTRAPVYPDEQKWRENYCGLPNGTVKVVRKNDGNVDVEGENTTTATVEITCPGMEPVRSSISSFVYVVGRRGSLAYLDQMLELQVLDQSDEGFPELHEPQSLPPFRQAGQPVSGSTLRDKALMDVEVAPSVFAVGSLTGDSLIRFAYGGCIQAAGRIMTRARPGFRSAFSTASPTPARTPARRASPTRHDDETYHLTNGHANLDKLRWGSRGVGNEERGSAQGEDEKDEDSPPGGLEMGNIESDSTSDSVEVVEQPFHTPRLDDSNRKCCTNSSRCVIF